MQMHYNADENKLGKNVFRGASIDMKRDPEDYGI